MHRLTSNIKPQHSFADDLAHAELRVSPQPQHSDTFIELHVRSSLNIPTRSSVLTSNLEHHQSPIISTHSSVRCLTTSLTLSPLSPYSCYFKLNLYRRYSCYFNLNVSPPHRHNPAPNFNCASLKWIHPGSNQHYLPADLSTQIHSVKTNAIHHGFRRKRHLSVEGSRDMARYYPWSSLLRS